MKPMATKFRWPTLPIVCMLHRVSPLDDHTSLGRCGHNVGHDGQQRGHTLDAAAWRIVSPARTVIGIVVPLACALPPCQAPQIAFDRGPLTRLAQVSAAHAHHYSICYSQSAAWPNVRLQLLMMSRWWTERVVYPWQQSKQWLTAWVAYPRSWQEV
jgi:hypothetical protein